MLTPVPRIPDPSADMPPIEERVRLAAQALHRAKARGVAVDWDDLDRVARRLRQQTPEAARRREQQRQQRQARREALARTGGLGVPLPALREALCGLAVGRSLRLYPRPGVALVVAQVALCSVIAGLRRAGERGGYTTRQYPGEAGGFVRVWRVA